MGGFFPTVEPSEHVFTADASWWRRINLLELVAASGEDGREFLAVDRLRFERLDVAP